MPSGECGSTVGAQELVPTTNPHAGHPKRRRKPRAPEYVLPIVFVQCCHASGSRLIDGLYDTARVTTPEAVQLANTQVERADADVSGRNGRNACILQGQATRKNRLG